MAGWIARPTASVVVAQPWRTWPTALLSTRVIRMHHQSPGRNGTRRNVSIRCASCSARCITWCGMGLPGERCRTICRPGSRFPSRCSLAAWRPGRTICGPFCGWRQDVRRADSSNHRQPDLALHAQDRARGCQTARSETGLRAASAKLGDREVSRLATRCHRLVKDYERYAATLAGLHVVAFACFLVR